MSTVAAHYDALASASCGGECIVRVMHSPYMMHSPLGTHRLETEEGHTELEHRVYFSSDSKQCLPELLSSVCLSVCLGAMLGVFLC